MQKKLHRFLLACFIVCTTIMVSSGQFVIQKSYFAIKITRPINTSSAVPLSISSVAGGTVYWNIYSATGAFVSTSSASYAGNGGSLTQSVSIPAANGYTSVNPGGYIVYIFVPQALTSFRCGIQTTNYAGIVYDVLQWGTMQWTSMYESFSNVLTPAVLSSTDIPDFSKCSTFQGMFTACSSIDSVNGMSKWNTSAATTMNAMFSGASNFSDNLGAWNLSSLTSGSTVQAGVSMFANSGMACVNYSKTLMGWAKNPNTPSGIYFNAQTGMTYSADAVAARTTLTSTLKWIINGDAQGVASCVVNPVITSVAPPNGYVGGTYPSTPITADNPLDNITVTGLPPGLTFDPATGLITGTPTQAGTFPVTVTVTDPDGDVTTVTYNITIDLAQTLTGSLPNGSQGVPYTSPALQANNGGTFSSTDLPTGLSINPATGVVSGTPSTPGTYTVHVTATDPNDPANTITVPYTVVIDAAQAITGTLPNGNEYTPYTSAPLTTNNGGTLSATGLPPGLTFDPSTGVLSGTPTKPGTYTVQVTATDPSNPANTITTPYTVVIAATPPTLSVTSLNPGMVPDPNGTGHPYSNPPITGSNGATVTASGLPPGLTYDPATGLITGTPPAGSEGVYNVVFTVTDPNDPTNVTTVTLPLDIQGNPLAVSLSAFTAAQQGSSVRLNWSTATELNNSSFSVLRSADATNWSTIGSVVTKAVGGNSSSLLSYTYTDVNPLSGVAHYRLAEIDNSGNQSLSNIVTVNMSSTAVFKLYPNPTANTVYVSGIQAGDNILVYTYTGTQIISTVATSSQAMFSLSGFSSGMYVVKVLRGGESIGHDVVIKR